MKYRICLLRGDGIGPEVIGCAEQVLRSCRWIWNSFESKSDIPLTSDSVRLFLTPPWKKSGVLLQLC